MSTRLLTERCPGAKDVWEWTFVEYTLPSREVVAKNRQTAFEGLREFFRSVRKNRCTECWREFEVDERYWEFGMCLRCRPAEASTRTT